MERSENGGWGVSRQPDRLKAELQQRLHAVGFTGSSDSSKPSRIFTTRVPYWAALWSCVPHRLVEAAGADRVSDRGPPPPLAWETLDASEPLPPLAGDANLLDASASPA